MKEALFHGFRETALFKRELRIKMYKIAIDTTPTIAS